MNPYLVNLIIQLVLLAVAYVLTPKPKIQNAEVQEGSVPAASASNPVPVVFGEVSIKQSNCVFWGDPSTETIYSKSGK